MAKNVKLSNTVSIASGGTTSTTLSLVNSNLIPLALVTPAALTSTTFTFQSSADDVNYYNLYYGSTQVSITVAASRYVELPRDQFKTVKYLKIVGNSSESATRTITVVVGE